MIFSKFEPLSFRTVRNMGLITLSLMVVLVSVLSYSILLYNTKKLQTIIEVEEAKLRKWHYLQEMVTEARDSAYGFYLGKSDSIATVMELIEMAFARIEDLQKTTSDQHEITNIKEWMRELIVFRQAIYAYGNENREGYAGGTSAKEMENAALSAARNMVRISREIDKKITLKIAENNQSILKVTAVSRKILSIILIASVLCTALIGFFMNLILADCLHIRHNTQSQTFG